MSDQYDWASAALAVELCDSAQLSKLLAAADLDPLAGDVADMDLSNLDLRNQRMNGWDLSNANFEHALIAEADLRGALLDPKSIVDASDWFDAKLDQDLRRDATFHAIMRFPVKYLQLSNTTSEILKNYNIFKIDDLMGLNENLIAKYDISRQTIVELEEVLKIFRIQFKTTSQSRNKKGKSSTRGWVHILYPIADDFEETIIAHMDFLKRTFESGLIDMEKPKRRRRKKPTQPLESS